MSRVAGRLFVALMAALVLSFSAKAADRPMGGGVRVTVDACRAPRVDVVRYKEQVCQKGAGGYAACRWVEREHAVESAGVCEPVDTAERARPTERGVFPPYSRVAPRG
ncbi:hypothetical protein ACFOWB_06260 [Chenggangzhangella methanolivorans]|uniref:hypothetical protein n=1 Tax=Chenggangzhangella methanolivorans TaxID=1437009 RepID=UPI00360F0D4D